MADLLAGGDLDVVILSGRLTADSRRFVSRAARRAWDVRRARPHRRSHQRAPANEPISYLRTAEVADLLHVPPKTVSPLGEGGQAALPQPGNRQDPLVARRRQVRVANRTELATLASPVRPGPTAPETGTCRDRNRSDQARKVGRQMSDAEKGNPAIEPKHQASVERFLSCRSSPTATSTTA